ncbi:2-oxoacid:acceptor oxidoreductase subunit alpha [Candidatus Micrarchaeota archaeon]|nr:2-oxoacid:acceptor oxidoreductase subunit alpha [Candidatus Micrarchaeota archaeon]
MDFICKIAGQAGAGVMVAGRMLINCFTRGGYCVVGYPEYPSLIRGGHNTVQVRVSDSRINSPLHYQDVLIALNKDGIFYHMNDMNKGGIIIYDHLIDISKFEIRNDVKMHPLPLSELTKEVGGTEQMKNTAAIGAALAIIDYPLEVLEEIMKDTFGKKGEEIVRMNIKTARAAYDYIRENRIQSKHSIKPLSDHRCIAITGNEAIALGAIKGGMKFYSAYPMTPASSILHYLAELERDFNLVVKQTEDEIAAMNYAIGAGFAGARSMTGTSGGGFALMTEALGLAAISETPVVVVIAQRTGPSTGMPTWTEQGDLNFAMYASQGDLPRVVLAPGDVNEAFALTAKAHNLAEKYQVPVLLLTDKHLSESVFSTEKFPEVTIERGKIATKLPELEPAARWKRYELGDDGISERALPGTPNGMHVATSYEHDETGFSTESFTMRVKQADKRMKKLETMMPDIELPVVYGPKDAEITLVGWGSMKLSVLDALPMLENINFVHFTHIYPLDEEKVKKILGKAKKLIMVENNSTAQFAGILRRYTGIEMDFNLLKYDGRPVYPEQIVEEVEKLKKAGFRGNKNITILEKEDKEYYNPQRHGL